MGSLVAKKSPNLISTRQDLFDRIDGPSLSFNEFIYLCLIPNSPFFKKLNFENKIAIKINNLIEFQLKNIKIFIGVTNNITWPFLGMLYSLLNSKHFWSKIDHFFDHNSNKTGHLSIASRQKQNDRISVWQIAIIQFRFQLVFWRTAFYFISDENRTLGFSETRLNRLSHVQLPFFESKEILIFHLNVLFMFY